MFRSIYEMLCDFSKQLESFWSYIVVLLTTCAVSWYSYTLILDLPKPETIVSTGFFYLQHAFQYLGMMGMAFISFIMLATLAFASIRNSTIHMKEHTAISIILGFIGTPFAALSLYFLAYGIWLLFVLSMIALIGYIWLNSNTSSGRRR